MIETRLLCYFLAIAREQSITRAAETLHVTQPTLSRQVMELENQLGKPLLIRGKKKILLTEEGVFLQNRAQEMMELMDKMEAAFREEPELVNGDVYLGSGETPFMKFVADIFKVMQMEYPNVHLHIHSGDVNTLLERLDKGLLDVCILFAPPRQEKYEYRKLDHKDRFGLLMPKDCHLAKKESVSFKEMKRLPIIFPDQAYDGKERLEWFGEGYDSLNIIATYNLLYNATFLVEQGIGYAFCLEGLADISGNRNLTFRPFEPEIHGELYVITKKYQTFSSAVKVFLNRLEEKRIV